MRMFRAVKTGVLVTFITASGIAVAQDQTKRRRPHNFRRRTKLVLKVRVPDRSQWPNQNPTRQDDQGWRRLGPAPYPQNGGDPRYAQAAPKTAIRVTRNPRRRRPRTYRRN